MKKNKILTAVFAVGCILVIALACGITLIAKNHFGNEKIICDGIKIGTIDVGGMTEESARGKIEEYIFTRENRELSIQVQEHTVTASCKELGLSFADEDYAGKALAVGKEGNFLERFRDISEAEKGEKSIELDAELNEEMLKDFIETNCSVYDIKAKDSKLKVKNGELKATKSQTGQELQLEETLELVKEAVLSEGEKEQNMVTAVVETTEPEYTQEEVSKCTDLLGSYSTTYSTYQVERSSNVATAAGRINGTVVYPGKTFSTIKVIKDRTLENGYKAAPEYSSGKVIDGIGGGVCQVSTTLYNAVINAELEIVERSPHSMVVSYVDVSRDAAIAGDYKDFKFKNNTEYPVYIMGNAYGGTLSFKVYGCETRPENRSISFESEITDTIEPGEEVVTEDPSLPESYRSVTQSAHVGYRAKLWKIVKVDGVQTEKIQVNSSSYNPSPQYVTVGKQKASPTPDASAGATDKKAGQNATSKPKATAKTEKKATPKPKATAKPAATPRATTETHTESVE